MNNSFDFLYAEDDADTAFFFQKLIAKLLPDVQYKLFGSGRDLLDYLFGEGEYHYPASPQPKFVLTDLRMPGADGYEILRSIRTHQKTHTLPVIIYTSSYNKTDVSKCYELGCSAYVVKPLSFVEKEQALKVIIDFWLGLNTH